MNRSVIPSAKVIQWRDTAKKKGMFSLWGFPSSVERIQAAITKISPEEAEELRLRREAEKKVEEAGRADCVHCKEEIIKNERELWESDFLLEYCTDSKDHKHRPLIVWKTDG
jgi:hypothetical protein